MALAASVVSTSSLARQGSSLSLGRAESDDLDTDFDPHQGPSQALIRTGVLGALCGLAGRLETAPVTPRTAEIARETFAAARRATSPAGRVRLQGAAASGTRSCQATEFQTWTAS